MPMHEIRYRLLFQFDELSDEAKEKARDWWRQASAGDNFFAEHVEEDFRTVAGLLGVEVDKVSWSGFSSQGDGASFTGSYRYAKGGAKALKDYAPQDKELARIAAELTKVQSRYFWSLSASIQPGPGSNHYSHSRTMSIDVRDRHDGALPEDDEEAVSEALIDLADWLYRQLERAYEYEQDDEQVDETIRINEYTFTEEGAIA